ncbi:adenosylmethionine--8-amino-7-oxononanoate transaminase [Mechercharimyces sp. CAU 1602]|uniref:adenosylmethionine--8-amino-7-oxononanoate transaminase n=1 Tax=Mechercharimyces sp. CAU 1602 TaxID=2973933 RepID=UPI0021624C01|nr:adenosylmethionine--8-amino-7-oxononanoate transaminase [Mechercharimyces sp. CAU 1602]MCS1352073.1 adenosylmethionine--8-amino-7-oxononanoate transaminase [Mechercharimyces sp. CAU 1602]
MTERESRYDAYLEKNRRYLWNPFTQMKEYLHDEPLIVERGEGTKLIDIKGKVYYDGNASVWLNPHGHGRKELNDAIKEQLDQIAHSTLLGAANVPALDLAERLVGITPAGLNKVFYSDSGAAAVEIGLKIAYQYWQHRGESKRTTFISMKNAYHGDTIGAVSVGGMDLFHATFEKMLFPTEKVSYPYPYRFQGTEAECMHAALAELEQSLQQNGECIAGVIVEPLVQGAGGMIMMPAGFLKKVEELCRDHGVLLIADEVATGFGRTGEMFACDHEEVSPDIMTLGKKLTGGYLPVAATLTTDEIYDAFYADPHEMKTFFHGHSYTGNQLGCAVALANLDIYENEGVLEHVQALSRFTAKKLRQIAELEHVGEVRQKGLMIGIELVADRTSKAPYPADVGMGKKVCRRARQLGLITRPLGDVITFMPMLVTSEAEMEEMIAILAQAIAEVTV